MSWAGDVWLLARREVLNLVRDPQFWLTLLVLPLLMTVMVGVLVGLNTTFDDFQLGVKEVVIVDETGALRQGVEARLHGQEGWRFAEADQLPTLREEAAEGTITGILRLEAEGLDEGAVYFEALDPLLDPERSDAVEAAVLATMLENRLGEAPNFPEVQHVSVGGPSDASGLHGVMLLAFFFATTGVMLMPVMTAGSMAAGLLRDRRCGFSSVLVCASEPYRVFVGQILGGGVMALAVGAVQWSVMVMGFLFSLLYEIELPASSPSVDVPELRDEKLAMLFEHVPELIYDPMTWVLLVVLSVCGSASWWTFSLLTLVGVEANDRTITTVNAVWLGVYSVATLLLMVSLQDPGGIVGSMGLFFPGAFMVFAWMAVVFDVWSWTTVLACVVHLVVTAAALRLAAVAYVTDETALEIGTRWWRLRPNR